MGFKMEIGERVVLAAGVEEPQSVTQRDNTDLECGGQVDLKPSFEVQVDHKNTELIKEV